MFHTNPKDTGFTEEESEEIKEIAIAFRCIMSDVLESTLQAAKNQAIKPNVYHMGVYNGIANSVAHYLVSFTNSPVRGVDILAGFIKECIRINGDKDSDTKH